MGMKIAVLVAALTAMAVVLLRSQMRRWARRLDEVEQ